MADDYATWMPQAEQNWTDEDVERLQTEIAELKDANRYWTDESYRAKFERLSAAGEAYVAELRADNAELRDLVRGLIRDMVRMNEALGTVGRLEKLQYWDRQIKRRLAQLAERGIQL